MKTEDIDRLIARFYEGETDEDEEKVLINYFTGDESPLSYESDRAILLSLSSASSAEYEVPSELENRISTLIDSLEGSDKSKVGSTVKLEFRKRILSIAATVLLVVSIGFWYQYRNVGSLATVNAFEDPSESEEIVVEALRLFSDNFSKGTSTFENADNRVDNTFKILGQVLNEKTVQK